jgi:hypothetical protein
MSCYMSHNRLSKPHFKTTGQHNPADHNLNNEVSFLLKSIIRIMASALRINVQRGLLTKLCTLTLILATVHIFALMLFTASNYEKSQLIKSVVYTDMISTYQLLI